MNLTEILLAFSLSGAEWVLYLLVVLSIVSVTIMLERLLVFYSTRSDVRALEVALAGLLAGESWQHVSKIVSSLAGLEASVIANAMARAELGPDAVSELLSSSMGLEKLRLERGVAFLGTVGSNAPFIGLFGTVLGIIKAFHDLAQNRSGGSEAVMSGISEALVATAIGLLVAIPAVMAYNFFQRRIRRRMTHLGALGHMLLAGIRAIK